MSTNVRATMEDLMRADGKAELINGEIVIMSPTGRLPNRAAGNIYINLREYEARIGGGHAYTDNVAYKVDLPHRESFSPDVSFDLGDLGMGYAEGAPVFAVGVRSENDYGARAERAMAEKRRDYFTCGTLVVWDVDLLSDAPVRSYRADAPDEPQVFRRGEMAHAEPAVPGWTMAVNDLFI